MKKNISGVEFLNLKIRKRKISKLEKFYYTDFFYNFAETFPSAVKLKKGGSTYQFLRYYKEFLAAFLRKK